jgi:dihydropteroate synthase
MPAKIMGILNVTPDSFSDGGHYNSISQCLTRALEMAQQGADIIDIGAESTRPGAQFLPWSEEWQKLEPVLTALAGPLADLGVAVSVDSWKPEIMERALGFGCTMLNSVRGFFHLPEGLLKKLAALPQLKLVAMHMHGIPVNMQKHPLDAEQALMEVELFAKRTLSHLESAGVDSQRVYLDPGIGFGKSDQANLQLMQWAMRQAASRPMLVGISRKGFIGRLFDLPDPLGRDGISKAFEICLMMGHVQMIRTHDVQGLRRLTLCGGF